MGTDSHVSRLCSRIEDLANPSQLSKYLKAIERADTNSPLQFQKSSQLIIRVHDEALTIVAMRVSNPFVRPLESIAET